MSASNRRSVRHTAVRRLPLNPSVENLRKQAKRLAAEDATLSLQQAQHRLATEYGAANWVALLELVETRNQRTARRAEPSDDRRPLPAAANRNDLAAVRKILNAGEFTQLDLDLALARSVLRFRERKEIARLLVEHGADPNGEYGGNYGPIVFVTGECLDPDGLQFLIDAGADVTFEPIDTKYGRQCPMSYALGTYARDANERKHRMIEILLANDAYPPPEMTPPLWAIHRGDAALLSKLIDSEPSLVAQRFAAIPYGNMNLDGTTLLHAAVEFIETECVDVLLARGADVNARAESFDDKGQFVGNQTPIFHCVATCQQAGEAMLERLLKRSEVDLSVRATFRATGEVISTPITPLEWATLSREKESLSWRRASDRELALLRA